MVSAGKLTRVTPESVTDIAATFDFDTVGTSSSSKLNGISSTTNNRRSSAEEASSDNAAQTRQKSFSINAMRSLRYDICMKTRTKICRSR
uniref:Bm10050 n=1 Tax=Brugia malayi TaxID=6279 RepID=A0A1I9GDA6_BRUMA|nr:Bm10050 [Brugia malayi]